MLYQLFVHSTTNRSSTLYDVTRDKDPGPARSASRKKQAASRATQAAARGKQAASRGKKAAAGEKQAGTRDLRAAVTSAASKAMERELEGAMLDVLAARQDAALAKRAAQPRKRVEHKERAGRGHGLERLAEQLGEQIGEHLVEHLGVLDVWTREEPRGRRPRFTRDDIAAAAVRIADEEGFSAVSMRHLAAELGAGTMTLYHYVRTKDELLTLVTDAVMGEVVVPPDEPLPIDWREAISVIAHRSRASLQRHPWILDITDDPPFGPNSVRHFDQTLEAVSSLDISLGAKLDIVTCVDEYVFGHCLHQRNNTQAGDDSFTPQMTGYVDGLVASGEYPQLAALVEGSSLDEVWSHISAHLRDATRFDRNLERLLDGIEGSLQG
jgi:AcrR family transcriptional regulator